MAFPDDLARLIDDHGVRNALDAKGLADLVVHIVADEVIDGDLLGKGPHDLPVFVGDADEGHPLFLVRGIQLVEMGNAVPTGWAPGGPELKQVGLALDVGFGARKPQVLQVLNDRADVVLRGRRLQKHGDEGGRGQHGDEVACFHGESDGSGIEARENHETRASAAALARAGEAETFSTSTATTLYSGHRVSASWPWPVTLFTRASGKWKVV